MVKGEQMNTEKKYGIHIYLYIYLKNKKISPGLTVACCQHIFFDMHFRSCHHYANSLSALFIVHMLYIC